MHYAVLLPLAALSLSALATAAPPGNAAPKNADKTSPNPNQQGNKSSKSPQPINNFPGQQKIKGPTTSPSYVAAHGGPNEQALRNNSAFQRHLRKEHGLQVKDVGINSLPKQVSLAKNPQIQKDIQELIASGGLRNIQTVNKEPAGMWKVGGDNGGPGAGAGAGIGTSEKIQAERHRQMMKGIER